MKRFSLNSLRSQLLLWISLPVLVVLLTVALAGVQGHGQAMHDLVQSRADGLAQAVAALIDARIDQEQDALLRLSLMSVLHEIDSNAERTRAVLASVEDEFVGGVALWAEDEIVATAAFVEWSNDPAVTSLAQDVVTTRAPGLRTVERENNWFLLHAVPVPSPHDGPLRALIGVVPLASLSLRDLTRTVVDEDASNLSLIGADGEPLFALGLTSEAEDDPVFARATVPTTGWQVILMQSAAQWIPPVLRFGNMLLLVVLAAATLSVLSAYFGLQRIIQPLERLNRAVGGLGRGDFEAVQQPVGGVQEIEELQLALTEMAQQIRRYQQELQDYIGAITLGQEEERKRVARDLHDETVQALIALNQQVEMVEHRLADDPERAVERLHRLRPLIGETISGIRRQIQNLRPLYLEDLGFAPALEMLVQQTANQHGLVGDFEVTGDAEQSLPPAVEISGYRIVQEALQNVANHAKSSWVHVELIYEPDAIVLHIEDDGVGFDAPSHPPQLAQAGHYGLLGMSERVRLHGGTLQIDSRRDAGATVTARLPVGGCARAGDGTPTVQTVQE
jgi:signal transduction histidine kinase